MSGIFISLNYPNIFPIYFVPCSLVSCAYTNSFLDAVQDIYIFLLNIVEVKKAGLDVFEDYHHLLEIGRFQRTPDSQNMVRIFVHFVMQNGNLYVQ